MGNITKFRGVSAGRGGGGTPAINTANPIKTGQTTSYASGDDGDLEEGRLTDFTTLDWTNPFGNTNRFTDELGGQNYVNSVVIDWSTYNQVDLKVIGFEVLSRSALTFVNAMAFGTSLSIGGFVGWRVPNYKETQIPYSIENGYDWDLSFPNLTWALKGSNHWTSSTPKNNSANAFYHAGADGRILTFGKAATLPFRLCRTFTWNGNNLV